MPLSSGDKLGPYTILALAGKGGMGEVYRAHDDRLRRDVAIKVSRDQFTERFTREARTIASLNHTNIAHLYDVGPNYLVMEYVEGEDLKGPLSFEDALPIIQQLIDGIEAAHEKNIIHRDLKPANIKITPEGVVKILDFGLAKAMEPPPSHDADPGNSPTLTMGATVAGTILGTAAYMAPEQAKGKAADKRSDVWSFGVVVYEMLTGKRLFQGESVVEILGGVLNKEADVSAAPARVHRLLGWCLEKDRKKQLAAISDARRMLEEGGAGSPAQADSLPHKASKLPWAVAAVAVVGMAAAGTLAFFHLREEPPKLTKFEFAPPENGTIRIDNGPPAVSPDGRRVAYRAFADGKSMLWVRDLDSLNARMLPGTENPASPFWAPDSRQLAFFSGSKLMKIDVTGGPATTITAASTVFGGTWNQDDVIVFGTNSGTFRVAAAGGTPTPVTELDKSRNETRHVFPHFLPDGRYFLYTAPSSDTEKAAVFVGDLQSPNKNADKKLILQLNSNANYVEPQGGAGGASGFLLFVREGTLMAQPFDAGKLTTTGDAVPVAENVTTANYGYFGSSRNGTLAYASGGGGTNLQITWYDRFGKVVGTVGKPADMQTPRLSPNGKMVAVDRLDPQSSKRDIWLHDLARGSEQRLTFADSNFYPVWSPDSLRVAYTRGGKVMVKSADGTGQEEVLETTGPLPQDWTRDGGFLISAQSNTNPKTSNDLWALPLSGGKAPRGKESAKPVPLRETEFAEWHGRVSPDGRWLAYMSDESKRWEVYVVGFPSLNGHWQVSVNGGLLPVWSRDGRELYFMGSDNKLMAAAITPGAQFQAGVPQPLFNVRIGASSNRSYDVSADGRFLIASPVEQSATVPMTVVLNWQAGLKK